MRVRYQENYELFRVGRICLRLVACVPNVANVSGWFILDCPFGFL